MPTAFGPLAARVAFHFSAMMSKASSQVTGSKSPSLWYSPSRLRSSGVVSRSAPYMILERK